MSHASFAPALEHASQNSTGKMSHASFVSALEQASQKTKNRQYMKLREKNTFWSLIIIGAQIVSICIFIHYTGQNFNWACAMQNNTIWYGT